ncbi:mitochondrial F1F0 ATP synthase subunit Atp14 [Sphaerosporella brunnea]|uniref:Mitochondrial F1F0 ATP synthase subunit Atp14 n=1 Tax=Sphaerosporella brunnea TaxID=1250544 RepID=A0A5J5FAU6_9PEZI|nr:mitochondrial F1F0 ATP synthase subunit Atp14 [Sphaerosporella brunnea]
MLAQSLRVSRSILTRAALRQSAMTRTFIAPTAARQAITTDPIQDIYLRELRAYKPKPESAAAAAEAVKKWSPPAAPPLPDSADASIANELAEYEAQAVEVEGQDASAAGEPVATKEEDWFEEDVVFGDEKDAHH